MENDVSMEMLALERRILPLRWDAERNQINENRRIILEKLEQEYATLKSTSVE